jgi:hypothetical protein
MPTKSYIVNKDKYNTKSSLRYTNDPEYREKKKLRSKAQYERKIGNEVLELKSEKAKLEHQLSTIYNEYMSHKEKYDNDSKNIINLINEINVKIKEKKYNNNTDSDSDKTDIDNNNVSDTDSQNGL